MKPVHILGDINLDVVMASMQGFPSLGKEILARSASVKAGGSAANVAMMLAAKGGTVRLFGRVGQDHAGVLVSNDLSRSGLDTSDITIARGEKTGITVSFAYPDERMYVTFTGTLTSTTLAHLKGGYIKEGTHLHLTSFFLLSALRPQMGELLQRAKEGGMSTSVDPGGDPSGEWNTSSLKEYYRYIDWFLPNSDEIQGITGAGSLQDAFLIFPDEVRCLAVKAGEKGVYTRSEGRTEHFPAIPVTVVDTTCAGDCFDAGFLTGVLDGKSFQDAVQLGLQYAAQAVATVGLPIG